MNTEGVSYHTGGCDGIVAAKSDPYMVNMLSEGYECLCAKCPECLEPRDDDDRVTAGMKCFSCAYSYPIGGSTS